MDKDLRSEKIAHLQTRLELYRSQSQLLSVLGDRANAELGKLKAEEAAALAPAAKGKPDKP